jgi:hypothetical protein
MDKGGKHTEKKPLIVVSICAVVLLVLGSLSNVVGYQSIKTSGVNDSSLFSVRTQRATNQQQNTFTLQYLGKGIGNFLQFPMRDNRTESLKRAVEIISKMNDKTFEQFKELYIKNIKKSRNIDNSALNKILLGLNLLRTQSDRNNLIQLGNDFRITHVSILPNTIYESKWCDILYIILLIINFYIENFPLLLRLFASIFLVCYLP